MSEQKKQKPTEEIEEENYFLTEEQAQSMNSDFIGIPYLSIKAGESAIVRFRSSAPEVIAMVHERVWDPNIKQGKGGFRNFTCTIKDCPLCNAGVGKPRILHIYRLVHIDNVDNGKQIPKEKFFVKGVGVHNIIKKKASKKPLESENIEIERIGSTKNDTTYLFDWTGDNGELPGNIEVFPKTAREAFKPNIQDMKRLAGGGNYEEEDEKPGLKTLSKEKPAKPKQKTSFAEDDEDDIFLGD